MSISVASPYLRRINQSRDDHSNIRAESYGNFVLSSTLARVKRNLASVTVFVLGMKYPQASVIDT